MKTYTKKILIVFIVLLGICIFWYQYKEYTTYKPNPIRPKDFPDILVAPKDAISLDHSTPLNHRRAPRTYRLSFIVNDPYPSEKTKSFIKEHLKSHEWQQLKYHLINPDTPASCVPMLYPADGNEPILKGMQWPKLEGQEYPISWMEDWLNNNDEHISISFEYLELLPQDEMKPPKGSFDLNNIYVDMTFFERDSWIAPEVAKYKKLHPDDFEKKEDK